MNFHEKCVSPGQKISQKFTDFGQKIIIKKNYLRTKRTTKLSFTEEINNF